MATILKRQPWGVTVQNDAGIPVVVPEAALPSMGIVEEPSIPVLPPPVESSVPSSGATQNVAPATPEVAAANQGAPGLDIGPSPVQTPPAVTAPAVSAPPVTSPAPAVPSAAQPGTVAPVAQVAPVVPPEAAPEPAKPELIARAEEFEVQADELARQGNLTEAAIQRQAASDARNMQSQKEISEATQQRINKQQEMAAKAEETRKIAEAAAEQDLIKARDAQASYDIRLPKDSTAQKIGKVISIALGGIGQALMGQGGENPVLAILDNQVKAAAEERMRRAQQLGQQVGVKEKALDTIVDKAKSAAAAQAAYEATEWAKAAKQIETAALATGGEALLARSQGLIAEARGKADELTKRWNLENRKVDLDERQLEQQAKYQSQQIGLGYAELKEKKRQFTEELKLKQAAAMAAGDPKEAERLKMERELGVRNPITGELLTGKSGGLARKPEIAEEMDKMLAATATSTKLIDTVIRLADKSEGASELLQSAEWQEIKANEELLKQQVRLALQMGTLDKGAADSLQKMFGGVDPTSFIRDAAPGFRAARKGLETRMNDQLVQRGFDRIALPDLSAPTAATPGRVGKAIEGAVSKGVAGETSYRMRPYTGKAPEPGLTSRQSQGIQELTKIGTPTPPERFGSGLVGSMVSNILNTGNAEDIAKATEGLKQAAQNAPNPKARAAAASALLQISKGNNQQAAQIIQQNPGMFSNVK